MKWKDFDVLWAETKRFNERCQEMMPFVQEWDEHGPRNGKNAAALKRASLDLTRALARFRQS